MNIKLSLTVFFLILLSESSFAQLAKLIDNFKPAYSAGNTDNYIDEAKYLVDALSAEEKSKGERILSLFKVLTGEQQDMPISSFNKAMHEVGLSAVIEKNINTDLTLLSISLGKFSSRMAFNEGKKTYRFTLDGFYKSATRSGSTKFEGGIGSYRCRIIDYSDRSYRYTVKSLVEIPSIF